MDASGNAPLHNAAKQGDVPTIVRLVQAGADVNQQNNVGATPLVYASMGGKTEVVKQLLMLRADSLLTTRKGKTAILVAQEKGHNEVVALIQAATAGAAPVMPSFGSSNSAPSFGAPAQAPAFGAPAAGFGGAASPFPAKAAAFGNAAAPSLGTFAAPTTAPSTPFGATTTGSPAPNTFGTPPAAGAGGLGSLGGLGLGSAPAPALALPAVASLKSCAGGNANVVTWEAGAMAKVACSDDSPGVIRLPGCPEDSISSLCWAPAPSAAGQLLSAAAWDGTVRVWALCPASESENGGSAAHILTYTHERPALASVFSWSGDRIFSGGADGTVRSVDLASGSLCAVGSHAAPVAAVATCEAHPHAVLSASWDKTLAVWDLRQTQSAKPITSVPLPGCVRALDLRWPYAAVAVSAPGSIQIIDMRLSPATPRPAKLHPQITRYAPKSVAIFPGNDGFCVGTYDGRVGVHYTLSPNASPKGDDFSFECHRQGVHEQKVYAVGALTFVPSSPNLLVTAGTDGECAVWDLQKRKREALLVKAQSAGPTGEPIGLPAIAFSPSADMLAYARSDDWSGGQAQYDATKSARHTNHVRVLLLSKARLAGM